MEHFASRPPASVVPIIMIGIYNQDYHVWKIKRRNLSLIKQWISLASWYKTLISIKLFYNKSNPSLRPWGNKIQKLGNPNETTTSETYSEHYFVSMRKIASSRYWWLISLRHQMVRIFPNHWQFHLIALIDRVAVSGLPYLRSMSRVTSTYFVIKSSLFGLRTKVNEKRTSDLFY